MTANETDPDTGTRSTRPGAPAEAASDAPTGNPSQPRPTRPEGMGELDRRAIDTVRVLAMDAVQKAGNGHLGTAMSVGPTPICCSRSGCVTTRKACAALSVRGKRSTRPVRGYRSERAGYHLSLPAHAGDAAAGG